MLRRHNFSLLIGVSYDIHSSSMPAEPILVLSQTVRITTAGKHQNITGPSIKSSHQPYSLTQRSNRFPPPNRNKAYVCTLSLPKEEVRYRPTPRSMDAPPLDPPSPREPLRLPESPRQRSQQSTNRSPDHASAAASAHESLLNDLVLDERRIPQPDPVYRIRTSQSPIHPPHKGTPHSPFVTPPTPD